eukprot:scpid60437/ scgid34073/ MFS-type transporter SLC18B1; Solute carrier family 18 member B1
MNRSSAFAAAQSNDVTNDVIGTLQCDEDARRRGTAAGEKTRSNESGIGGLSRCQRFLTVCFLGVAVATCPLNMAQLGPFFSHAALAKNPAPDALYHTAIGAVFSMNQIGCIAFGPFIMHDLPNIGSKQALVLGVAVQGACSFLFSVLDRISSWRVFLAYAYAIRFLQGMAFTTTTISAQSYLTQIYPTNLGFVNALMMISLSLGHAVATVLAGGLYDVGGFMLPFIVTGAIAWCVTVALVLFIVDVDALTTRQNGGARERHTGVLAALRIPWIWFILLIFVASNLAYSSSEALLATQMRNVFGVRSVTVGAALALQVLANIVSSPIVGKLIDNGCSCYLLVFVGMLLNVLGCLLVGPSSFLHIPASLPLIFVAMVPWGVAHVVMAVSAVVAASQHLRLVGAGSAVETRLAVAGLARLFLSVGYGIGPLAMSPLVAVLDFQAAFTILACVYLVLAGLLVLLKWLDLIVRKLRSRCKRDGGDDKQCDDLDHSTPLPSEATELQPLKH